MSDKPVLQVENLTIGYTGRRAHTVIASDISITVNQGKLVCLLGANGVGKSTLLRTIAGLQPALHGHIWLDGDLMQHMNIRTMARKLSIVLTERPDVGLMNGYALVALGRHPHTDWTGRLTRYDEAIIQWAIHAVGAADIAPHPFMNLSDGQRQKLMIARALAQESMLIVLDEPTAFLDLPRRVEIMRLLKEIAHGTGRAVLVSTHDLDLALRHADELWLMSNNAVVAGTPEDLILSGQFEAAFHDAGLHFDRRTGTFKAQEQAMDAIAVYGEDVPYIWTCRALERAGFRIAGQDEKTKTTIRLLQTNDSIKWQVEKEGRLTICESIEAVLSVLK